MGDYFTFYFMVVWTRVVRDDFRRNLQFFPRFVIVRVFVNVVEIAVEWARAVVYWVRIFVSVGGWLRNALGLVFRLVGDGGDIAVV